MIDRGAFGFHGLHNRRSRNLRLFFMFDSLAGVVTTRASVATYALKV